MAEKWEKVEAMETLLAARVGDEWTFNGDLSELMQFVFTDDWSNNMYAQYYVDFWQEILDELKTRKGNLAEIDIDVLFEFGLSTEDGVRDYMKEHKGEGPRLLVMHRDDDHVSMTCAYLRSYTIKDMSVSL